MSSVSREHGKGCGRAPSVFVDEGLFATSLVTHCMLAWSRDRERNAQARTALAIPPSETIVLMIAVGCIPDEVQVACSYRRPASEILRVH